MLLWSGASVIGAFSYFIALKYFTESKTKAASLVGVCGLTGILITHGIWKRKIGVSSKFNAGAHKIEESKVDIGRVFRNSGYKKIIYLVLYVRLNKGISYAISYEVMCAKY